MFHSALLALILTTVGPPVTQVMETARPVTVSNVAVVAKTLSSPFTTDYMNVSGLRWLTWEINFTRSAATAITMSCEHSPDASTWFATQLLVWSSGGTMTSSQRVWSETVATSAKWVWTMPVYDAFIRCTFTGTAAAAGDTVTIKARTGK